MDAKKRKKLEESGWRVGSAKEFLGLSPSEIEYVDLKLALAKNLVETRKAKKMTQVQLAHRLKSSQSRVAKMEAGDSSVSIDLLVRSLLELRSSRKEIERTIGLPTYGNKKMA
jgi:ribosome-binding protein aMBF1 (putative translation factor)